MSIRINCWFLGIANLSRLKFGQSHPAFRGQTVDLEGVWIFRAEIEESEDLGVRHVEGFLQVAGPAEHLLEERAGTVRRRSSTNKVTGYPEKLQLQKGGAFLIKGLIVMLNYIFNLITFSYVFSL